jgi:hypothetical protein
MPMAAVGQADMWISIRHGIKNGALWHNTVIERCRCAAQVLNYGGLSGGPWPIQTVPTVGPELSKRLPQLVFQPSALRVLPRPANNDDAGFPR